VTDWLDPLRAALDTRAEPVWFFFRDDDAGWDDAALEALLDVFEPHGLPLDVAAIPLAATVRTVELLTSRQAGGRNDVRVHQHGLAHVNHEPEGRKCEFGPSRSAGQQREDIARGREVLRGLFGDVPAVFTPPWNRCAPWTAEVLRDLGFAVLSRDVSAGVAGVPGLVELPITVDWFAKRKKVPLDRTGRGRLLAETATGPGPVGLMLHHEVMSEEDLADLAALLELVAAHPAASAAHLDRLAQSRVP
jgi:peptidoglycan/xylan/chitin deacetylase (PgdA/CDA1 family)